jgi:hypothetical protein
VGGLGTFAALLSVVRQFNLLRAQNDLVQKNVLASLDGQLYVRLDSFNRFVVEHDAEYDLQGRPDAEAEATGHWSRRHRRCDPGFTGYQQIYQHHVRYDPLDTEDWERWQKDRAHFSGKPYAQGYRQAVRDRYTRCCRDYADGLVSRWGNRSAQQRPASGTVRRAPPPRQSGSRQKPQPQATLPGSGSRLRRAPQAPRGRHAVGSP